MGLRHLLQSAHGALALLPLALTLITPPAAAAQPGGDTAQVDAIRCWRRVSRNAVYVGERFTMDVTCGVVETDTARTVPDQAALEPETIDVAPFEVLDGEHYEDIRTGPYRFFQYHYTLRVIDESSFGEDIEIPAIDITYRVERRVGDNPALVGRELRYVLPPEPVRVLSLVPDSVVDIRDFPPATFGDAQARGVSGQHADPARDALRCGGGRRRGARRRPRGARASGRHSTGRRPTPAGAHRPSRARRADARAAGHGAARLERRKARAARSPRCVSPARWPCPDR